MVSLSISAQESMHKKLGDLDLPSLQFLLELSFSSCTNFLFITGKDFMRSLKPVCNIYSVSLIKGITMYIVTGSVPSGTSHHK